MIDFSTPYAVRVYLNGCYVQSLASRRIDVRESYILASRANGSRRVTASLRDPLSLRFCSFFFISELLERFNDPENDLLGLRFVDDMNLITWGATAEDNYRRLILAYIQCEEWAQENDAHFAPDKYQLLHFTKRR